MTEQALYDFSPAIRLMLMGLVIALGPLAWVWLRSRNAPLPHRLRMLTLVTLFLTFDLVLFGAFTRLTDSGLGCPDWPGCYGSASPLGAHADISQAQAAMPTGPSAKPAAPTNGAAATAMAEPEPELTTKTGPPSTCWPASQASRSTAHWPP